MAEDGADGGLPVNPLDILMAGLETVWRADEGMTMACLRTFLALCWSCAEDSTGLPVLRLAAMLGTPRTNVTRHLKFLRARGFVETFKDPDDSRIDRNRPSGAGSELYARLQRWPPHA